MVTHEQKVDFITRFRDQYPDRPREECVQAAGQLLRLARKYQRLAEEECNGHPIQSQSPPKGCDMAKYVAAFNQTVDRWEEGLERRQLNCANKILTLCARFDLSVTLGGDPRGFTVKVHFPDGRGNTWGGDAEGWGIPA